MKLKPLNKESILQIPHILRGFSDNFVGNLIKLFY
jgi:hypothetical protein